MITLKIDNRIVEVEEGTPLHKATLKAGIEIPIMCYYEGMDHFTSCMICMVKDRITGKLIPSCSVEARKDMDIITGDTEVMESRRTALELLLSEHVGDCEAPCRLSCPAGMDIPLMNRLLALGDFTGALEVVRKDIALPSVLGRICPAPCESACRRKAIDEPVSICMLKRFAGDNSLQQNGIYCPVIEKSNGYKIGIIGAGPGGLSAAYYLQARGFQCDIFESQPKAGGAMRTDIGDDILPKNILDKEISIIENMGVKFIFNHSVNNTQFVELQKEYNAVLIACSLEEDEINKWGLEFSGTGIKVDRKNYQTCIKNVFAAGSALRTSRMAIRSLGQGKETAFSIEQFVNCQPVEGEPAIFNSRFGKLFTDEYAEYLKESFAYKRFMPEGGIARGFSVEEVKKEAARCLRCDCRGKDTCLLRKYSDQLGASQKRFSSGERLKIKKFNHHDFVIYEPAKCIKCSICVRITSLKSEEFGLTFIGRGFNVEVGIPFNEELSAALTKTAEEVIKACPTGALERK